MFSSTVFSLFTLNIDDVGQKIRLSLGGCKKNGRTIKTANICDLFNHNLAFSFGEGGKSSGFSRRFDGRGQ